MRNRNQINTNYPITNCQHEINQRTLSHRYRPFKQPYNGPRKAAEIFLERHPEATAFKVTLYGSLAATGKGHMTNIAITEVLQPVAPVEIIWEPKIFLPFHPNGMKFVSVDKEGKETDQWVVFSIGGGALAEESDGASSVNTPMCTP